MVFGAVFCGKKLLARRLARVSSCAVFCVLGFNFFPIHSASSQTLQYDLREEGAAALSQVEAKRMLETSGSGARPDSVSPIAADPLTGFSMFSQVGSGQVGGQQNDMLLEADDVVYDRTTGVITAHGNVQIYYDGQVVEADQVSFDRANDRVVAVGSVTITQPDGHIITASSADLTSRLDNGVVRDIYVLTPDQTRFAAVEATRENSNAVTRLSGGVYTACLPCRDHPEKAPQWQIKSKHIVHDKAEGMVHHKSSWFEFYGLPLFYVPFFSHPDPSLDRKSGFLPARFGFNDRVGYHVTVPYYFNLAPHYDLTISPMVTEKQGLHLAAEFRYLFKSGQLSLRPSGVYQIDKNDKDMLPPGDRKWRGAFHTEAQFDLSQKWQWGWDFWSVSDKRYLRDYNLSQATELTSQAYLTGQGDWSFFDGRVKKYEGLTVDDTDKFFPVVHPVVDYFNAFQLPSLIGTFGIKANITSLTRQGVDYEVLNTPSGTINIVKGMPGTSTRASVEGDWQHTFTDGVGIQYKPFAKIRADFFSYDVDGNPLHSGTPVLPAALSSEDNFMARVLPTVGMDVRWPWALRFDNPKFGSHVFEPVGQVIVRPNETRIGSLPNEDAQSFVFDDTTLFEVDKFSGFDRIEGGSRINYGLQYSGYFDNDFYINALFGQSIHLFGRNSFAFHDLVYSSLGSGLETDHSDYVGRLYVQPNSSSSLSVQARFDEHDFNPKRVTVSGDYSIGKVSGRVSYANIAPSPERGVHTRQQGTAVTLGLRLNDNWMAYGGAYFNLETDKRLSDYVGLSYGSECLRVSLEYQNTRVRNTIDTPNKQLLLRVNLITIGETELSQGLSDRSVLP